MSLRKLVRIEPEPTVTISADRAEYISQLVCEYGQLIRQEMQFTHLASPESTVNAEHARQLQGAYYAEIRAYLKGTK